MRKLRPFEYFRPDTLAEALEILDGYGARARVLAGGTDLLVAMKHGKKDASALVDIKRVAELSHFTWTASGGFRMGALWTVDATALSADIRTRLPMLRAAALAIGHPQVRARATVAGNLCNGSPSADMAPSLLALEARIHLARRGATRVVPLREFYLGPFRTVLEPQEIVTEIEVPAVAAHTGGVYHWLPKLTAVDESLVGVAAVVSIDAGRRIRDARIAMGSMAPVPVRAAAAEEFLRGQSIATAVFKEAARIAATSATPRRRAEYRQEMAALLLTRALGEAVARAS